jgi:hypothetical protein
VLAGRRAAASLAGVGRPTMEPPQDLDVDLIAFNFSFQDRIAFYFCLGT